MKASPFKAPVAATPAAEPVVLVATPAPVAVAPGVHKHFLSLGQFVGLALLGLQAYHAQDAPNSGGPAAFLNPSVVTPYLQGILSLFPPAE